MSLPDLIGQSVYRRRLIFRILRSSRSMTTINVITRQALSCHCPVFYFLCHCSAFYFMSLPGLIGQSVYRRRLIFRILRSSRSMTTKNIITRQALSCHGPVFYFLCHCLAFYFMSLPDFFFIYVIARLDRAIRLSLSQSAELNFPFFQNKIHCLFHQIKE